MNILRFAIVAIRVGGIRRFASIAVLKIYRSFSAERTDRRIQSTSLPASPPTAFSGLLPIEKTTASRFKRDLPGSFSSLLSAAQKIRAHHFEFLGIPVAFGTSIDWHLDPATQKSWQKRVYQEISLRYVGSPIDAKHVWELNRHQYFVTLAQAFFISGDSAYRDELLSQWLDWIEKNPYRTGINWASPLEVGVRLISWTLAFQFMESHLSQQQRSAIVNSMWQQAAFLSSRLSLDKIVRTNHLIGEAAGLYVAASSFTFPESEQWGKRAKQVLEEEMLSQIFEDGGGKEQSSAYLRFDVDLFLVSFLRAKASMQTFTGEFGRRLQKMITCLEILQTPDNRLPRFGDCDNGRGVMLAPSLDYWDIRGLAGISGVLFNHPVSSGSGGANEESFWFLPEAGWNSLKTSKVIHSIETLTVLPQSGYVIFKAGESATADYCFLRAGSFGLGGRDFCSHSHNDLFSPILYLDGTLIFTDTGTSIYLGNDVERDYLRSASAHNSTFAQSWDLFESKQWFGWKKAANGKIIRHSESSDELAVECGYEEAVGVPFKRSCYYQPLTHQFRIEDLFAENTRQVHSYFHMASGMAGSVEGHRIILTKSGKKVALFTFSDQLTVMKEAGWVSESYGSKKPAEILHFTWDAVADQPARFTISRPH